MKIVIKSLTALYLLACMIAPTAMAETDDASNSALVYVVPVHEMIEPALVYVMTRQIKEGQAAGADAFIFTMNTPGGAVGAAEEIIDLIFTIDVPTYTFVERNAISAGALIALATDHIYMAPGSKIGDAMPFQATPLGGAAETPDRMVEKIESYVAGMARATAQRAGHNPDVAMAMVRPDFELIIDDEVICAEGELLTLTNIEAEKRYGPDQTPLLSAGTVDDIDELLRTVGLEVAEVVVSEISFLERVGRMIPPIGPLLLMAGMLGIYIEMRTPGLGLPGLLGGICLIIFFWGHHIAGLAGMEDIVIFGVGLVLILLEIFVIPGFGIAGISGVILMLTGIFMAMVEHYPGGPSMPLMPRLEVPIRNMSITIIGTGLGVMLLGKYLPKSSIFRKLSLEESTSLDRGYSSSVDWNDYIGKEGITNSPLRPSGTAQFGDERLDVIADGAFVDGKVKVRVASVRGNKLFVEPVEPEDG